MLVFVQWIMKSLGFRGIKPGLMMWTRRSSTCRLLSCCWPLPSDSWHRSRFLHISMTCSRQNSCHWILWLAQMLGYLAFSSLMRSFCQSSFTHWTHVLVSCQRNLCFYGFGIQLSPVQLYQCIHAYDWGNSKIRTSVAVPYLNIMWAWNTHSFDSRVLGMIACVVPPDWWHTLVRWHHQLGIFSMNRSP